jgi:hypothetical protein
VLRHAILIDTGGANVLPVISVETVSINMTVVNYAAPPVFTSGIRVIEGQVAARNVTIIGGDIGVEVQNNNTDPNSNAGGALFFASQMEIANPSQYAVLAQQPAEAVNAAAVRISDSVFFADFGAMYDCAVSYVCAFLKNCRFAWKHMYHTIFLNIATVGHKNFTPISAQHCSGADITMSANNYITSNIGLRVDKTALVNNRAIAVEFVNHLKCFV